jgi:hypothetical protein
MQDIVFQTEFKDVAQTTITNFPALKQQGDKRMAGFIQALGSNHRRDLDESEHIQEYAAGNPFPPARTVPADAVLTNATTISNYTDTLTGGSTSGGTYVHNYTLISNNSYTSDHSNNPDPIIKNGGTASPLPQATTEQVTDETPATPETDANQFSDIPLDTPRTSIPAPEVASPVPKFPPTIGNGTDKYNGTYDWNITYTGPILMYLPLERPA